MSFLGSIFGSPQPREDRSLENPSISLTDASAWRSLFGGGAAFSGELVTEDAALGVPAVWTAVNVIAGSIASLPLHLYKRSPEGRQRAEADPLDRIVHDQVNSDYLTSFAWRKWLVTRLLLTGRAFTFIERGGHGRVTNLWPLDSSRMAIEVRDGRRVYRYRRHDGRTVEYGAGEIIDLVWMPGADGISHVNPLDRNRNAIGLAIAAERYASIMFENGGIPPLALNGPTMSPQAAARASGDIAAALKATRDEKRNVLITPTGYDLKPIGFEPMKAQMLELRKFQITEVARVFNIPPAFLQDLSTGTYSNTEQQDLAFVKHTLTPWLELIEQELNAKLFSDKNRTNFVEFNLDGMLRGDLATRMTAYAQAVNAAVLTPNEARAIENRPAKEGGDDLLIQGATVKLNTVGAMKQESDAEGIPAIGKEKDEDV
ncbi:phage portal protein [Brevundimonas sp. 2R-24]|uniref:Phage portal protein n=1 Tax=Peiella sedimenti TaxID=3061083 RepID=A0ABT8SML1_9CAUL|nr:phage portal protein [Caulobacteraceae bacterium XZ-24]